MGYKIVLFSTNEWELAFGRQFSLYESSVGQSNFLYVVLPGHTLLIKEKSYFKVRIGYFNTHAEVRQSERCERSK